VAAEPVTDVEAGVDVLTDGGGRGFRAAAKGYLRATLHRRKQFVSLGVQMNRQSASGGYLRMAGGLGSRFWSRAGSGRRMHQAICQAIRISSAGLRLCELGLTSSKLIRLGVEVEDCSDGSDTVRLGTAGEAGPGSVGSGAGGVD
jgi:hypothetical protein